MSIVLNGTTGITSPNAAGPTNLLTAQQSKSSQTSTTATQATGALTTGLNPCVLDFRDPALTTGVSLTRFVPSAISLVIPSGATLGAVTTVQARLVLIAIDNAGTIELAVVNLAGGVNLDETSLISTTAISAAATANNVVYSTTARTNVAYRVIGFVDAVNTAGAWGNPVLVQGIGGQALAALSSLGYGQTWQVVTGSRVFGTTYYNTTGKPLYIRITAIGTVTGGAMNITPTIGGTALALNQIYCPNNTGYYVTEWLVIPAGSSYSATAANATLYSWSELR